MIKKGTQTMKTAGQFLMFAVITTFMALSIQCGSSGPGSSSEVGYIISGKLFEPGGGKPVDKASVVMRPSNFLPAIQPLGNQGTDTGSFVCSTFTNNKGEFIIKSAHPAPEGTYCIEGRDRSDNCVLIDSIMILAKSSHAPVTDTVKAPAVIQGAIPLKDDSTKAYVRVYGLDVLGVADSQGVFSLKNLPEGHLRLHIMFARGADESFDTLEVATTSGATRIIDTLVPQLYGVMYNGNGGTAGNIPTDPKRYSSGETAIVLGNTGNLAKPGFSFGGWNTAASGNGLAYSSGMNYIVEKTDVTLYAQWKPDGMVRIFAKDSAFLMGDTFSYDDRAPVHTVRLSFDYWLDTSEVTQGRYNTVMTAAFPGQYASPAWNSTYGTGKDYPAYFVTWYDAVLFCNALTKSSKSADTAYGYVSITGTPGSGCVLEGLAINGNASGFQLPTEAQWEYAYHRGATSNSYIDSATINEYRASLANYGGYTHPVALTRPNASHVYDMTWNVWEWCNDWYGTYGGSPQIDPTGPASGSQRVIRGGSWASFASSYSLVNRGENLPAGVSQDCGFRVCLPAR
jgi:uncharacterized repeat protein (TIGR02543 family)